MESSVVKCSKCQAILYPDPFNTGRFFPCPSCESSQRVEVFPAILRAPTATVAEPLLVEGQSSCFYHSSKKASIVCDGCGRFLCGLCDLELNGRHLCPACLETGQKKAKYKDLENSRVRWDYIALAVAILPLLCIWPSIIGGPYALFLVLRHRKTPCGIVGRSGLIFLAAGLLALLECIGWIIALVAWLTS